LRLREPAAWVALGALVLNLMLVIVALVTIKGSLASVGWVLSARVVNPLPLLVLTVLVSFCVLRERTPHARQLTIISLVAGVIAVLLGLGLALLGFGATAPILAVLAALVPQAISIIAVGLLIKLLQLQAVPRRLPAGIGLVPHPSDLLPAASDPRLQPTWQPDSAAGAAWRTAGDAAAGAPATGWGTATPSVGWQPIPTQPLPGQPMPQQSMPPQAIPPQAMPAPAVPTQGNGPRPQGRMPEDPTIRSPLPAREQQQPGMPRDPWADQGERNSQPPALDWWGRPQA
jgi:hypothetical protein